MADIQLSAVSTGETSITTATGAFDVFMQAMEAHILQEYNARRITGDQYPQIYLGAMQTALTQAVTFVLQKPMVERQAATEESKKLLVERQTKGFDDDAKQKLLKQVLDSWSVAYSVAKDANSIPDAIKVNPIDNILKSALVGLGIMAPTDTSLPSNPLGEI